MPCHIASDPIRRALPGKVDHTHIPLQQFEQNSRNLAERRLISVVVLLAVNFLGNAPTS